MEIIQNNAKITITDPEVANYSYLHIVQRITIDNESIFDSKITTNYSEYNLTDDSYYIASSMKITTIPGSGYYISGDQVYNEFNVAVTAQDLLNIVDIESTNIVKSSQNYIFTYYIKKYYLDLIQSKFLKGLCACGCMDAQEKITVDALTMGLNLLEVLVANQYYYEAERLIEKLTVCTGIVNVGCGCHG